LRADIETALPLIWGRRIISVFIGGGTPSLLSAAGVDALLSDVRALLVLEADCEITLEANPGTVEAERFAAYRASGVNRLSLGIQSFDEAKLHALGRIHDRRQALAAVEVARRAFDNFNLDLMYGLPQQTLEEAERDVEQALLLEPPHLSLYQLTLEPNTVFAKRPPPLPEDDIIASMHEWIEQRTAESGYRHYEVSAYARGRTRVAAQPQLLGLRDYLGVGPGAHSKLSFPHRVVRQVRYRSPASYLQRASRGEFLAEDVEVGRADLPFEFMLNSDALTRGCAGPRGSPNGQGCPPTTIQRQLEEAERRGLMAVDHARWRPTALGARFLSDLQALFLPPRPRNRNGAYVLVSGA